MGEIADMMIEGAMCQSCGEFLGDEVGYPRYCRACACDVPEPSKPKVKCPTCGKRVAAIGLQQHIEAKHGQN